MSGTIEQRWIAAQVGERRFHCDWVEGWRDHSDPEVRRRGEHAMRAWYAGMLRIPTQVPPAASVTDFACGPQSLLLTSPTLGRMVAVDPLEFLPADEATYREHGIERFVTPAEYYTGEPTNEVWMYNCLQHVMDWEATLRVACRHAKDTLRLFEWIGVPTDDLHLHVLQEAELRRVLVAEGFRETLMVRGETANHWSTATTFYAAVWERVA